ncbi:urease accessory protein [Bradyrhizobium iriomotense]|uniref:Nickel/cobalt efflux system n=1 Tax=Bradyrhizobium iriomotense TaxID=441950 RepID=A0ABQ6ANS6_9BRAD|nr:urease accessory protein [Bradyrhizobium iriomotense]GLR83744.1 hydantoin utilization protein A [Bradyrhizobium iriomotense]
MIAILGLGFLLGMQHALEADHVAAVSAIAARRSNAAEIVKHGLTWGLGHTVTLFLFAGAALLLGQAIPQHLSVRLETAVGIMLMILGGHVLWRLWCDRVHFHQHRHPNGASHLHLHAHANETGPHNLGAHEHAHGFRWRTLIVGLMHGMAGSAALLVLAVSQVANSREGLLYMLLFGVGSMIGMAALSTAIAIPLVISARTLTWANRVLQLIAGGVALGIGLMTVFATTLAAQPA